MARSRSLPSNLFDNPDFFDLDSNAQVILFGLVLNADDHGRGLAHVGLLSRKLNKAVNMIEESLMLLERCKLLVCYQDEQQRYYALTRWLEWETLSKPARSKYPAPPQVVTSQSSPENPGDVGGFSEHSEESRETTLEEEEEEEEEKEEEGEGEGEEENIIPEGITFLSTANGVVSAVSQQQMTDTMRQVASILKIPQNAVLARLIAEYLPDPMLSIIGEADAAREWIDDPRRNKKKQRMTPAFFRRWLKREQASVLQRRQSQGVQAMDQQGSRSSPVSHPISSNSLMDLEARYQVQRSQGGK